MMIAGDHLRHEEQEVERPSRRAGAASRARILRARRAPAVSDHRAEPDEQAGAQVGELLVSTARVAVERGVRGETGSGGPCAARSCGVSETLTIQYSGNSMIPVRTSAIAVVYHSSLAGHEFSAFRWARMYSSPKTKAMTMSTFADGGGGAEVRASRRRSRAGTTRSPGSSTSRRARLAS